MRHLASYGADLELRDGELMRMIMMMMMRRRRTMMSTMMKIATAIKIVILPPGEGHSALWCAVREQREDMVAIIIVNLCHMSSLSLSS